MHEQEQLARAQRGVAEQVYSGTYEFHSYQPMEELVPGADLGTFLYISSLVSFTIQLKVLGGCV